MTEQSGNIQATAAGLVGYWNQLAGVEMPSGINLSDPLAYNLILEEFQEYQDEVIADTSVPDTIKELTDLLFVVLGAYYRYGVNADVALNEVLRSNFSKFCKTEQEAQDSVNYWNLQKDDILYADYKQVSDYYVVYNKTSNKILKGINYVPADFSSLKDI